MGSRTRTLSRLSMALYAVAGAVFLLAEIAYVVAVIRHGPELAGVFDLAIRGLWLTVAVMAVALVLQIIGRGADERQPRAGREPDAGH